MENRPVELEGMSGWRMRLMLLSVAALPAFSGYLLDRWSAQIVVGVPWSACLYLVLVHGLVLGVLGRRLYANIVAAAVMITLPVVFAGAVLSVFWAMVSGGDHFAAGGHYVRLCMSMLSVVPLALAMVALIPFADFERRRLLDTRGVSRTQKKILMALRVFHHVVFFVIPNTLEVIREERAAPSVCWASAAWPGTIRQTLVYLAVEAICSALQPIGLWAYEIAQLPEPQSASSAEKRVLFL